MAVVPKFTYVDTDWPFPSFYLRTTYLLPNTHSFRRQAAYWILSLTAALSFRLFEPYQPFSQSLFEDRTLRHIIKILCIWLMYSDTMFKTNINVDFNNTGIVLKPNTAQGQNGTQSFHQRSRY